jgi:hypothetical protein
MTLLDFAKLALMFAFPGGDAMDEGYGYSALPQLP